MNKPKSSFKYNLMVSFIDEAEKWLAEFDGLVTGYGKNIKNDNYALFRLAHTIKGSALTAGFPNTASIAIKAEHFLKPLSENGKAKLTRQQLDRLSQWSLEVRRILRGFETGKENESQIQADVEQLFPDVNNNMSSEG